MIFQRYIGFIISTRRSRYRVENDPTISREFTSLRSSVWLRQDPEGPETVELVRSWVPYPTSSTMNQKKHPKYSEGDIRRRFTSDNSNLWAAKPLKRFVKRLHGRPSAFNLRVEQEIPDLVEAFVEEVHRQFNVAVFACAAWKEEPNTMAVTQAARLPDPKEDVNKIEFRVTQSFAHFAIDGSVIGRGVAPQTPYPVAWPDFRMAGRPALPPQHPIWVQERANLKDWFRYLWLWQGGSESPNWNLIAEDINEGRFEYIEKSRLPNPFLPFQHIDLWDEETTRAWSTHIRSTMDSWGRVILEKQRGAVQFRKIDDIRGQPSLIYAEFCRVPPPLSSLDWPLSSMRFEKRVRQAIGELARPTAHDLYGHTAPLIELVLPVLPSICELEQALREYEGSNPPEAEPASPKDARTSWHPAALHVHREKPTFYKNSDISECTFPPSFASLMEAGHHQWAATALRDWLQTNPFWNEQAGCLNSGTNGVAVAFFAVAHYAANVSRVTPETDAEVEAMIQQDLHVYGRPELRTLEKCVDILLAQVVASARDQPRGLNLTDSDLEARYLVWQPTRWIERFGDGTVDELSQCSYARPDVNPFEAADVQDEQLHHEDAGREPSILIVSSSESESESESGSIDDESAWTSDDSRTTIRSGHMSGIDDSQNLVASPLSRPVLIWGFRLKEWSFYSVAVSTR